MNDGYVLFGDLRIAPFRDGHVVIAVFGEPGVAAPIICNDSGARFHDAFDEATERIGTPVGHHRKPHTPGIATISAVIECAVAFAVPYFNGSDHNSLVVHTSPFPACPSAHIGFVNLNMLTRLRPDSVLIRPHHADAQLVKNLEGSLVARQSELPLELNSRYTWCLTGDQISRPEPNRKRCVRALHDGAGGKARIAAAFPATQYAWARGDTVRFAERAATRTDKPVDPAGAFKIGSASRLIRKQTLKLWQRARKRQITSLKHIDCHGSPKLMQLLNILPVVGVCDNPISTVRTTTNYATKWYNKKMRKVFKTRHFSRWMRKTELTDNALCSAVNEMMQGLIDADLGGHVVKKRVGLAGRGKRGGARTLIATNQGNRWFFIYGFEKNDRANIADDELEGLQDIAAQLLALSVSQLDEAVQDASLKEICHDHKS